MTIRLLATPIPQLTRQLLVGAAYLVPTQPGLTITRLVSRSRAYQAPLATAFTVVLLAAFTRAIKQRVPRHSQIVARLVVLVFRRLLSSYKTLELARCSAIMRLIAMCSCQP